MPHDSLTLRINLAEGVFHAIADKNMPFVARRAEGMRTFTCANRLDEFGWLTAAPRHIKHLHAIACGQANICEFVIGREVDVGRHSARRRAPADGLSGQIQCDPFIAVLHGDVSRGGFAVDPHMAWRFTR